MTTLRGPGAEGPAPQDFNQRQLNAALDRLRRRLQSHIDGASAGAEMAGAATNDATDGTAPMLDTVCALFGLSPFERDVLLLCAGVELDARFAPICAALSGDPRRGHASFAIALSALPDPHWSALTPVAPLRRWRLVEPGASEPLTTAPLRIDERILHFLAGVSYMDDRLLGLLDVIEPAAPLPASHRRLAARLAATWSSPPETGSWPVVQLCGSERAGKIAICGEACSALGHTLLRLRAADVPTLVSERTALARLCEREMLLARGVLLLDCDGATLSEPAERSLIPFVEEIGGPLAIACREPLALDRAVHLRLDIERPDAAERRDIWRAALGPIAGKLNGELDGLAVQFGLDERGIQTASTVAAAATEEGEDTAARLWDACRIQARGRLDELAQRIDAVACWDDLVLPEPQRQMLAEIAVHVRRASTVYETWGFAAKGARGLGISALFAGASGTGKTMAAEVLANQLRLDLYRIDLSQAVSKYIGETEKNLRRIFEAAEQSGAILLFDEADALFGRRSEVKDSHDRYANIEVSYLLQRMESYRGLAILTTNMKSALDPAFLRRIRFVVQFPFPDAPQRAEIWRRIFPDRTPTEGLDYDRLARLGIAGGNIRCIALNAAFLAAEEGTPVRMAHVLRAAQSEYAKLEKPLTATEIGGWA